MRGRGAILFIRKEYIHKRDCKHLKYIFSPMEISLHKKDRDTETEICPGSVGRKNDS